MKSLHRIGKRLGLVGLLGTLALGTPGCMNRYQITLTSGNSITTKGKPKYDKATDTFRFKDMAGKPRHVPSITVRAVEPLYRGGKGNPVTVGASLPPS